MAYQIPQQGFRPYSTYTGLSANYYISSAGNDSNPGTSARPFLTVAGALRAIPINNPSNITLNFVGVGTFDLPLTLSNLNFITFQGVRTVTQTVTITNVFAANNDQGVIIDVNGLAVAADALRGRLIRFQGTVGGLDGWVYRNDATGASTRLYCSQGPPLANFNSSIVPPIIGDTVDLVQLDTTLRLTGGTTLEASTQANFQDMNLTGVLPGNVLFVVGTDKPTFLRCNMAGFRSIQAGSGGRVHIDCSYYRTVGLNTPGALPVGLLPATNGGTVLIQRGTIIDAQNAAVNANYLAATQGGTLAFRNLTIFRGLQGPCIRVEGGNLFTDNGVGIEDGIFFENASGVTSNTGNAVAINSSGFGTGGLIVLPNLHGAVTGNYAVTARLGALVALGSSSNIATATVVNAVSGNNGTSAQAWGSDDTFISGGSPFAPNSLGVTGDIRGLTVTGNNGLQTASISTGACWDSTGVTLLTATTTGTITMTTVGANGRDAGAATDGVWHVYRIWTPAGAFADIASTSSTSPTLPGGYVYFRRIGTLTYISGAVVGTITAGQGSVRTTIYTTTISQLSSSAGNFTQSWANYVPATAHMFYSGFHWFSSANANYSNSVVMDSSPWEGFFLIDSDGFSSGRGMIEGTIPLRPGGTRVFTATRSGVGTMGWYSYCMGYQESV